jgi:hypothetical protein
MTDAELDDAALEQARLEQARRLARRFVREWLEGLWLLPINPVTVSLRRRYVHSRRSVLEAMHEERGRELRRQWLKAGRL